MSRRRLPAAAGFSLLELMCVLTALAVLAAFAWPSYQAQRARGSRMSAMLALYRAAQYLDTADTADTVGIAPGALLPPGFDRAPPEGRASYTVQLIERTDRAGHEIVARPVPGGPMHGDACGIYVLRDDGMRLNREAQLGPAICWMAG